jgi:hypothetical protein
MPDRQIVVNYSCIVAVKYLLGNKQMEIQSGDFIKDAEDVVGAICKSLRLSVLPNRTCY